MANTIAMTGDLVNCTGRFLNDDQDNCTYCFPCTPFSRSAVICNLLESERFVALKKCHLPGKIQNVVPPSLLTDNFNSVEVVANHHQVRRLCNVLH